MLSISTNLYFLYRVSTKNKGQNCIRPVLQPPGLCKGLETSIVGFFRGGGEAAARQLAIL